jgi:hypothetical protein
VDHGRVKCPNSRELARRASYNARVDNTAQHFSKETHMIRANRKLLALALAGATIMLGAFWCWSAYRPLAPEEVGVPATPETLAAIRASDPRTGPCVDLTTCIASFKCEVNPATGRCAKVNFTCTNGDEQGTNKSQDCGNTNQNPCQTDQIVGCKTTTNTCQNVVGGCSCQDSGNPGLVGNLAVCQRPIPIGP